MAKQLSDWGHDRLFEYVRIYKFLKEHNFTINDVNTQLDLDKKNKKPNKEFSQYARVYRWLEKRGLTIEDINKFLTEEKENIKQYEFPRCPECEKRQLRPVAGNEDGGETILQCRKCRYSEYDGRIYNDVLKDFEVN